MGKRAIEVSGQLWQEMTTVGWRCGDRSVVECIEGLPEDAVFYDVEYRGGFEALHFVFEHPDWPEREPGGDIPTLDVVHRSYYNGARKAARAIFAHQVDGGVCSIDELAKVIQAALEDCRE